MLALPCGALGILAGYLCAKLIYLAFNFGPAFGMYGGQDRKLTLEAENHLAGVLIDRFGTDIIMAPHDKEHFHTSVMVTVSPQFFGWLAGIGKGIRIQWPEDVRGQYREYLQGIIDNL